MTLEPGSADHMGEPELTPATAHSGSGAESCLLDGVPAPCMLVVVGASGDLTDRKIIPAVYNH